jgi:hypothetical protein
MRGIATAEPPLSREIPGSEAQKKQGARNKARDGERLERQNGHPGYRGRDQNPRPISVECLTTPIKGGALCPVSEHPGGKVAARVGDLCVLLTLTGP